MESHVLNYSSAGPGRFFARVDLVAAALLAVGLGALYVPTWWSLAHTIWATDEQGHGPIILGVSLWLLVRAFPELIKQPARPAPWAASLFLALAFLMYVVGRSQAIIMLEVGSQILSIAGLLLLFKGWRAIRTCAFPLFFLLFMIPLPGALVVAATAPLKSAVSAVATELLHRFDFPIARSGVVLTVGQYQLLVADACAGLNSMFTLEALGLLYLNIMGYNSTARNIALGLMVIPISFFANVIRVVVLVLVTYWFGDEAGQGFVHGFAGIVLFMVALALILAFDSVLGWFRPFRSSPSMAPAMPAGVKQ